MESPLPTATTIALERDEKIPLFLLQALNHLLGFEALVGQAPARHFVLQHPFSDLPIIQVGRYQGNAKGLSLQRAQQSQLVPIEGSFGRAPNPATSNLPRRGAAAWRKGASPPEGRGIKGGEKRIGVSSQRTEKGVQKREQGSGSTMEVAVIREVRGPVGTVVAEPAEEPPF